MIFVITYLMAVVWITSGVNYKIGGMPLCNTKYYYKKNPIILGIYYNLKHFKEINYIILQGKSYIYNQIRTKCPVIFENFLKVLKNKLKIEECIYEKQDKQNVFARNWKVVCEHL